MVRNAEEVLQTYLQENPDLREEWEADQKLRNDPRITKVGAWLRQDQAWMNCLSSGMLYGEK